MRAATRLLNLALLLFLASLVVTSACQNRPAEAPAAAPAEPEYRPTATIKDLMLSIIDPSADVVWLSVTTVQNASGTIETRPTNDEEWTRYDTGRSRSPNPPICS